MLCNQPAEMCAFVCIYVHLCAFVCVETDRARLRMISREQIDR